LQESIARVQPSFSSLYFRAFEAVLKVDHDRLLIAPNAQDDHALRVHVLADEELVVAEVAEDLM